LASAAGVPAADPAAFVSSAGIVTWALGTGLVSMPGLASAAAFTGAVAMVEAFSVSLNTAAGFDCTIFAGFAAAAGLVFAATGLAKAFAVFPDEFRLVAIRC
jgi:hypothetical protein